MSVKSPSHWFVWMLKKMVYESSKPTILNKFFASWIFIFGLLKLNIEILLKKQGQISRSDKIYQIELKSGLQNLTHLIIHD